MNIICQIEYCLSFFLLSEFSSVDCISAQSDKSCTLDILYKTINSLGNSHPGIAFIVGCERFCPNTLLFQLELSRYWITAILHSCFLVSGPLITLSSLFCMCTNKSSNRIKRFLAQYISMKWWGCSQDENFMNFQQQTLMNTQTPVTSVCGKLSVDCNSYALIIPVADEIRTVNLQYILMSLKSSSQSICQTPSRGFYLHFNLSLRLSMVFTYFKKPPVVPVHKIPTVPYSQVLGAAS